MLIGGGSGGHITPLRAVAHEIKQLYPAATVIAVCEKGSAFVNIYKKSPDIDAVEQVSAGKYRRYAGQTLAQRILDFETIFLNIRDVFRTLRGYWQARRLLKRERPDALLIKGGFVAVPVGLAASRLQIPYITHDSDSTPGLANRIISRWAHRHATGMPAELYSYPPELTVYTGIPVSRDFDVVSGRDKSKLRHALGIGNAKTVITVIGGSQGGKQLNDDVIASLTPLMKELDDVAVLHIAGKSHEKSVRSAYSRALGKKQQSRVVVKGFVDDLARYTGAADIVVSRASATAIAELSLQSRALIVVPGQLADGHQHKNADYLESRHAAIQVASSDSHGLGNALVRLMSNENDRLGLARQLHSLAKPHAARELAVLVIELATHGGENEVQTK